MLKILRQTSIFQILTEQNDTTTPYIFQDKPGADTQVRIRTLWISSNTTNSGESDNWHTSSQILTIAKVTVLKRELRGLLTTGQEP